MREGAAMTALEPPTVPLAAPRRRFVAARWLTAAAGTLLLAGLAAILADPHAVEAALALSAAGAVAGLFALAPAAEVALRSRSTWLGLVLLIVAALALWALAAVSAGALVLSDYLQPFAYAVGPVAVLVGVVLLADDLRARIGLARSRTPWQRLSGTASAAPRGVATLVGGTLAAGLGLAVVAFWVAGGPGVVLLLALVAVVGGPFVAAQLLRRDRDRVESAREDARQVMAAHLHDSVLQTLALVQRQAHDARAVGRLARRQEHELRAWMAGEVELGAETLSAALRDAVAEVEDAYDAVVDISVLGDRALDRSGEALAAAAREALRNAARHAPGAPIYVFAQISARGAEVFVRDDGPGFVFDEVPSERRGVRDAVIGRMTAVGGRAEVESAPGEGTEIALTIGARP